MSGNTHYHILYRTIPLICQALVTCPDDETVWLEGLRLLSSAKLRRALPHTSSIWLPLLLKGLEVNKSKGIILESLRLLIEAADILEPMKSCLVKPLCSLGKVANLAGTKELTLVAECLGLKVWDNNNNVIGSDAPNQPDNQTLLVRNSSTEDPPQHPLLSEILAHNLPPKPKSVQHAWTNTLLTTPHDSPSFWLHNLYQATLEASNVPEMTVTSRLGPLIHTDLFQTAFVKCYLQLEDDAAFKVVVDEAIISLLSDKTVSKNIFITFLDLLAFCTKDTTPYFSPKVFEAAKMCALQCFHGGLNQTLPGVILWYIEQQAEALPTPESISSLVEANIRVGSGGYDAAWRTLLWLENGWNIEPQPMWITSLSHWQQALSAQDRIDKNQQVTMYSSFNLRMICYHALGDYQKGYDLAQNLFEGLDDDERRNTAHWATAAAWHMGDFDTMADYLAFHPRGTSKSLYKAIIDIHNEQYASAFYHINKAQSLSYDELQMQLGAGHQVALKSLAKTEFLVELQEAIQYKSQPELRPTILATWKTRFKRSHADANSWLKRLQIWTLACSPKTFELQACFLDTAKLCESEGMHEAAQSIIKRITPNVTPPGCKVEYTKLRLQHDRNGMEAVFESLYIHTHRYLGYINVNKEELEASASGLQPLSEIENLDTSERQIIARRYYRLGEWMAILQGSEWLKDQDSTVLTYTSLAAKIDVSWYDAAFSLAERSVTLFESNGFSSSDGVAICSYIVPALRGLFQAARTKKSQEFVIKALLRLVTLWFRFGESQAVLVEVENQLNITDVEPWLSAIPQLIARLGTPQKDLQYTLIKLLKSISSHYPHAVIWPLLTATQTRKVEHQEAARVIMDYICSMPDGTRLVDQAELVGRELIRTSTSWLEKWRGIIDRFLPRQDLMEIRWHDIPKIWEEDLKMLKNPETPDEHQFVLQYGHQLHLVDRTLVRYNSIRELNLVNKAYSTLYGLYGEIEAQLNQWRSPGMKLHLASTAPRLLTLRDCILTVPGLYDPHIKLDDQAFIDRFQPAVHILSSKQLPRKLIIQSNLSDHTFLLKGNEDLRGDERIMQLFNLINTLLNHRSDAFGRNLHLLPYEVVPLSPSAGLVNWVSNTQQLQSMIQANRDKHKRNALTNRELGSLLGYDPDVFNPNHPKLDAPAEMDKYDKLPLPTKVQRLEAALSHSNQSDIKDVLWQRSPSADIWIRRRTNFARTVGVASFAGYIIGLGDRHGSNILVDQLTWGALHIDFGDLFNVAQERSFLPEKVPFRLTRMMTNAFELASQGDLNTPGSRGTFKQASLITMDVLRDSRSTLLAMLEAFLYDPLLSWTSSQNNISGAAQMEEAGPKVGASLEGLKSGTGRNKSSEGTQSQQSETKDLSIQENSHTYQQLDNSSISTCLRTDSYMARVSCAGMTNSKALQVLTQIERKLVGLPNANSEQPLSVDKQVQELIKEAADLQNLSQGYVLGWIPHW
ncbi:hypothetical protein D1P53_005601 [Cryptococcus gattii VGV]|nr:hypothetical protein D1P53_005601 [Cryptococcus gattii VGV]